MGRSAIPKEYTDAALELMDAEGLTAEEAAERIGIGGNTVRRALRAREGVVDPRRPLGGPVVDEGPPSPLPAARGMPPSELLLLVKRILRARAPSALEELEEGLREAEAGEEALSRWLARPLPRAAEAPDPYLATLNALNSACSFVERLSPSDRRAATILNALSNLAKAAENIAAKRPRVETPDEVAERIRARRDDAVAMITQYTHEAEARMRTEVTEIHEWAVDTIGPTLAAELRRRLTALLGEPEDAA